MTVGSKAYGNNAARLAHDVAVIQDCSLNIGVKDEVLTYEDAELLYCNAANTGWLLEHPVASLN